MCILYLQDVTGVRSCHFWVQEKNMTAVNSAVRKICLGVGKSIESD